MSVYACVGGVCLGVCEGKGKKKLAVSCASSQVGHDKGKARGRSPGRLRDKPVGLTSLVSNVVLFFPFFFFFFLQEWKEACQEGMRDERRECG